MKPHEVSEIRKEIRESMARWRPHAAATGAFPESRITEDIMGILVKRIPVEHCNREPAESNLIMVEKAEWERLKALDT